jgi:eukaryotic translation initiation factor 2C
VDNTVVHSEFLEYYVNSHRALQGTAKSPKYTVLIDDNDLSMDQLALMTYHLCYGESSLSILSSPHYPHSISGHQIVNLPTSLPTPVYVASEYAQRGRKVFNQWDSDRPDIRGDFNRMTDELAYRKVEGLKRHRLNA